MNSGLINIIKNNVVLLTATIFLFSCVPQPIDIDVPPAETKLVVASQVIPNQIMFVALTRSFSALDQPAENDSVPQSFLDSILVSNALVTITYSGQTDTLFMVTPGIYASVNTLYVTGGSYKLNAYDAATNQKITATSTMLAQTTFDTVYPVKELVGKDTLVSLDYTFKDNPNEDNWYVINIYNQSKKKDGASIDINSHLGVGSNKLIDFVLLSDKTIKNIHHELRELPGVGFTDTLAVTVSNISEGYFRFLSAYKRSGTIFNQLTGEPINYPSNVIGGYGFFNTYYPDVKILYVKDY